MIAKTLEILCPNCESYQIHQYAGCPIPARVECYSCREFISVVELYCSGRAKKSIETIMELNTIEDLIKYKKWKATESHKLHPLEE